MSGYQNRIYMGKWKNFTVMILGTWAVGLKAAPICGMAKPWGGKDLEDRVQRNNLVFDTVRREHLSSWSETNGVFSPVLSALSLTPHLCSSKCVMGLPPAIYPPTDTARGFSQSDISLRESQISWSRAQSHKTVHFRCRLRSQLEILTQCFELRVPMILSLSVVICWMECLQEIWKALNS